MPLLFDKKEICTGCGACAHICSFNAITMKFDIEGFAYPAIDESLCKKCNRCEVFCQKVHKPQGVEGEYFAVRAKDDELLLKSASGGAFSLIAEEILSQGGLICGAAFGEAFVVRHKLSTDIASMRKSKYVQSDMGSIYEEIYNALKQETKILFSGTPCQCQGLKQFLLERKISCDNIFFLALICRGVQSPKLWSEYVAFLERDGKLLSYDFRDKRGNNDGHIVSYNVNGEEHSILMNKDPFSRIYIKLHSLRPSCYTCKFCRTDLDFDFTIGDFWGIEKVVPNLADGKGISMVIARNDRAKEIIAKIAGDNVVIPVSREEAMQPALEEPAKPTILRRFLFKDLATVDSDKHCNMELILKKFGI